MFLAHLPADYLLTRFFQRKFNTQRFLWIGVVGSVLPDVDLLYFYLLDHQQTLHHQYWTHIPFYWLALWVGVLGAAVILKNRDIGIVSLIFFGSVMLHIALDSVVGGIYWLYPINEQSYSLFTITSRYDSWIKNFIFHWTFLFEIAIILWAFFRILIKDSKKINSL